MDELNSDDNNNEEFAKEREKNKSLIAFAKLNKYFFIPALYTFFSFLSLSFEVYIDELYELKNPYFIKSILYDIPDVFAGLFFFISYFRTKANKKKELNNDKESIKAGINYIYNEGLPVIYNSKKVIMIILLLGLMKAIEDLLWNLIGSIRIVFEERLFYLFFIPLFSKILLKQDIYKHQYFSLLISIISIIFLIIPLCSHFEKEFIVPNILNFIKGIIYSLFLVITKFLVEKYYISPLKICLIIGIISIIVNLIGYTIYCLIINDFGLFTDWLDFSEYNIMSISIHYILLILFFTISELTLFLSLFYFYPTLIMITNIISPLLVWIFVIIFLGAPTIEIILCPIGYLIAIFSTFIYNELIILNCYGLNKNTKKFVNKRINKELEELKTTEEIFIPEGDDDSLINSNN